jgi:protein-S-isoprenylcysteine O-methyltransferase Ste14
MPERDAAAVRFFPPGIPLAAIGLGLALEHVWPLGPWLPLPPLVRYGLGGAIVSGAVLGLGLQSVLLFRRGGQSENPWKPTHRIEVSGPYALSRNPMYLQMVLVCFGLAVALANLWILLLTPVCAWLLQRLAILPEEAYLEAKFGDDYRAYCRRVRRWI